MPNNYELITNEGRRMEHISSIYGFHVVSLYMRVNQERTA